MTSPLAPYPPPEARDDEFRSAVRTVGAEVVPYGHSHEGRPLLAARLPTPYTGAPRVLCTANIHGLEFIGHLIAVAWLKGLTATTPLRRKAEVWVAPCLNPDGYARTWHASGSGPVAKLRPNARGVDLNRNFPLPSGQRRVALPGAGSTQPGHATYCGPHPLSEPETQALEDLVTEHPMHAAVNMHSFMGTIIPAHVTDRASFFRYRQLARSIQNVQLRPYWCLSSRRFDVFTGELEDHLHHHHRTWATCLETFPVAASLVQNLAPSAVFWRFNPRVPNPWIEHERPAISAFLEAALELPPP